MRTGKEKLSMPLTPVSNALLSHGRSWRCCIRFARKLQQLFALFFCILLAFGFAYARRLHESSRAGKGVGFVPLTLKVRAARGAEWRSCMRVFVKARQVTAMFSLEPRLTQAWGSVSLIESIFAAWGNILYWCNLFNDENVPCLRLGFCEMSGLS